MVFVHLCRTQSAESRREPPGEQIKKFSLFSLLFSRFLCEKVESRFRSLSLWKFHSTDSLALTQPNREGGRVCGRVKKEISKSGRDEAGDEQECLTGEFRKENRKWWISLIRLCGGLAIKRVNWASSAIWLVQVVCAARFAPIQAAGDGACSEIKT